MGKKLHMLIREHWDVVTYLFFGGLTTAVNLVFFFAGFHLLGFSATLSNVIAWAAAVVFAYLTNKPFVFRSSDWSAQTVIPEFAKFVGCRVASGGVETLVLLVTVDILAWNGDIWKILVSVLVVILNYIGSKFLVFKK